MCGIAGIVSHEPLKSEHLEQVARMTEALAHRGPDGSGLMHVAHVALGMRRLSIIDLAHGWQPLYNEDKSLALIANGEIYNYIELRAHLQAKGHSFRTGSDCEVIVHLYEEYGTDCVRHLRGMFAFALWDSQRQRLVLARDRMGEKPLYLYEQPGFLAFGSELKTLLSSGLVPFRLEPQAVDLYFHYQYVPEPATAIRGVRKLPAGSWLSVTVDPWRVTETSYWRMEDAQPLDGNPAELIRAELEAVSALVIRSDVPVGVALSGGMDSSAIAALAAGKYAGTLHAFGVGYSGRPRFDERAEAKALADHLSMPFHEIEISTADMADCFPSLVYWRDDPIADITGFSYYAVMKAAREHGVPVMLLGQGGDELFWGYPWVADAVRQTIRKSLLEPSRGPRVQDYLRLSRPTPWPRRAMIDWVSSLAGLRTSWSSFQRDRLSPRDRLVFYDLTPEFRAAQRRVGELYRPEFKESLDAADPFDLFTVSRPWPQIEVLLTGLICQTYLLENGIAQGDRLSMAASVELRLPLVDYRLAETVIGLRKARSDSFLPPKTWLREAVKGILPEWVLRRPKRGFQPPVGPWLKALFARYGRLLDDGWLVQHGVLTPESARRLSRAPWSFGDRAALSFKALTLEVWCRQYHSRLPHAAARSTPSV